MLRGLLGLTAAVLAMAALSGTGTAQDSIQDRAAPKAAAPLDVAAFAEVPGMSGPELSPDGTKVAAKISSGGKLYFAILPLDGGSKRQLVNMGDSDLNWWRWVNDQWLVMGVGQMVPVQGDDWYVRRAVSLNIADGKILRLGERQAGQMADDILWTARDGTPRILMASQTSIYSNEPGFWPSVEEIDISTGKRKTVLRGREGVLSWYADAGGTVRMGIGGTLDGRTQRVLYRPDADTGFRTIDKARTHKEELTIPAMFLKEKGKAVVISDDEGGFSALYEFNLDTLERGKQLFASKGFDIGGLVSNDVGDNYVGIRVNEDRHNIHWTDPQAEAVFRTLAGSIKGGQPRIVSMSRDRSVMIVHLGGADAPGAYFLYHPATNGFEQLIVNNNTIKMKRMHPVKTIRYKARDGLEIAAVMTLPKGKSKDLPLIVLPHGGPFARDTEEWDWWTQFLADRGYAVIQPNYRGSSGYGTEFTKKGLGQWGLAMQDDLNDAVTELAKLGIADPKRVCMVGASYGGYAALRAAQRDGKLYRCAVSYAGVADLNRMRNGEDGLYAGTRQDWLKMQAPDLKDVSPLNFPEQFSIPVLLVHGKKDQSVPVSQSRAMVNRLKGAGKDHIYIEQPEADHHFSRGEDRLEFLKALETFLAKHNPA